MIGEIILYDIEGELFVGNTDNLIYSKQLSLEKSWNTADYGDLALPSCSCVSGIREDFDNKVLVITYKEGIQPFNYESLKKAISPQLSHGVWRFLRFADQICDCLMQFHQYDLFQLVIHPERIAFFKEAFVILPTLSGVLPPLPELLYTDKNPRWLYYVSPEIIRTRGLNIDLLKAGDIYSLGRLFQLLLGKQGTSPEVTNPVELCQAIVENADYQQNEEMIDFPGEVLSLVRSMCARDVAKRPDLEFVSHQLKELIAVNSPFHKLKIQIDREDFVNAELVYKQYTAMASLPPFSDFEVTLLYCDMLAMKDPPEYVKAINELETVIRNNPKCSAAYIKKGDIYSAYTDHSQHLLLGADAYKQGCILNEWDKNSQLKYIDTVRKLDSIEKIARYFSVIPYYLRSPYLNLIMSESYLQFGDFSSAWIEIVQYFRYAGFNERAYELGLQIAKNMDPLDLIRWKYDSKADDDPNLKTALSIVFFVNNNPDVASKYLSDAINLIN
jgi:hypothetical protein